MAAMPRNRKKKEEEKNDKKDSGTSEETGQRRTRRGVPRMLTAVKAPNLILTDFHEAANERAAPLPYFLSGGCEAPPLATRSNTTANFEPRSIAPPSLKRTKSH